MRLLVVIPYALHYIILLMFVSTGGIHSCLLRQLISNCKSIHCDILSHPIYRMRFRYSLPVWLVCLSRQESNTKNTLLFVTSMVILFSLYPLSPFSPYIYCPPLLLGEHRIFTTCRSETKSSIYPTPQNTPQHPRRSNTVALDTCLGRY